MPSGMSSRGHRLFFARDAPLMQVPGCHAVLRIQSSTFLALESRGHRVSVEAGHTAPK